MPLIHLWILSSVVRSRFEQNQGAYDDVFCEIYTRGSHRTGTK